MILAWHFVEDTLRDGRPVPPDGEWLVHRGAVAMCRSGLHFSRHPFDALKYAPGAMLCRVEVDDIVDEDENKGVARRRRIIARRDLTRELRLFACDCAERVLHLVWPDSLMACLWVIDAARRFVDGNCDRDELAAAAVAAAYAATSAAASAATYAAASAATYAAAASAATYAADATYAAAATYAADAADAATYAADAAYYAERNWRRAKFARIVAKAFA